MSSSSIKLQLNSLPLRPSTLTCLTRRGFTSTYDVDISKGNGGLSNFATELGVSLTEAASIFREIDHAVKNCIVSESALNKESVQSQLSPFKIHSNDLQPATAASLILAQSSSSIKYGRHIVTFCQSIDSLLGGGFARAELTEIAGLPGVGKTQLAMQVCVDARLPMPYGGIEGEAVYIDSEGSFSPERCFDMAKALVDHVQKSAEKRRRFSHGKDTRKRLESVPDWFTIENILDGIHVFRVHDEAAQTATIYSLAKFLQDREEAGRPVRVVVIDSIAFHYRTLGPNMNYSNRTKCLTSIAAYLSNLSAKFDLSVIAINHLTTKVGKSHNSNNVLETSDLRLVPALGESWAHATTTRIILDFYKGSENIPEKENVRCCSLVKSPHKPIGSALFQVTENGIRGVNLPKSPIVNTNPYAKRLKSQ